MEWREADGNSKLLYSEDGRFAIRIESKKRILLLTRNHLRPIVVPSGNWPYIRLESLERAKEVAAEQPKW